MLERVKILYDSKSLEAFINSKVLIIGVGGVGGACFEALVRMGIRNIDVVDNDTFDESNLNRQLLSNRNNIGCSKVKEAHLRAEMINHDILVREYKMFLNKTNFDEIDITKYDYVIDCCDTVSTKVLIIMECIKKNIKFISSMGTGNRIDPTKLEIVDISKTSYDPLAKVMRKLLKEEGIRGKVPVLFSREIPIKVSSRTPGSTSFVPNAAGFCIASYVFNDIMEMGSDFHGRK